MKRTSKLFVVSITAVTLGVLHATLLSSAKAASAFGVSATLAKVADGWLRAPGGNVLATDGSSYYVANAGYSATSGEYIVKVTRSTEGGMTWGPSYPVATSGYGFTDVTSISVSGNANAPEQKIVHVVWEQLESDNWDDPVGIYYAWADDTELNSIWSQAFSPPIRINGMVEAAATWARTSLTTSPAGEIHVIFQGTDGGLYYTTAAQPNPEFSEPIPLPGAVPTEWGDIESALDSDGNLHVAYPTSNEALTSFGLEYTRKPAGASTWNEPVVVEPLMAGNEGFTTIAVYDPERVYIGKHDYENILVYGTTDGGNTWNRTTVFSGTATTTPTRHLSLAVSSKHDLIVVSGFDVLSDEGEWLYEMAMAFESNNRGRSWTDGEPIADVTSPSVKFDANGKAGMIFKGANPLSGGIYFSKQR